MPCLFQLVYIRPQWFHFLPLFVTAFLSHHPVFSVIFRTFQVKQRLPFIEQVTLGFSPVALTTDALTK